MKYVHRFPTQNDFETYVNESYEDPFVSWTDSASRIDYKQIIQEKPKVQLNWSELVAGFPYGYDEIFTVTGTTWNDVISQTTTVFNNAQLGIFPTNDGIGYKVATGDGYSYLGVICEHNGHPSFGYFSYPVSNPSDLITFYYMISEDDSSSVSLTDPMKLYPYQYYLPFDE